MLVKILNFFKSLKQIEKTPTTKTILACPFVLIFIIINLMLFVIDEQPGSVVSNNKQCSKIGREMLERDGSVVDAAIATMFCEGVMLPNRAGIGGGFTAVLYIGGLVETMIATPIVPKHFEMPKALNDTLHMEAAIAGGVPGELLGYWKMHRKYGLLPWRDLLQPTIELCEQGIPINDWLEMDIERSKSNLYKTEAMRQLYFTLMKTREKQKFKFEALASTLRSIAKYGPKVFYDGEIGKKFIEDLQAVNGVMTMEDLKSYNASWGQPVFYRLPNNKRAYTTGLPSMGAVVAMVLNVIKTTSKEDSAIFWHRTIEAMKHAFGISYGLADVNAESDDSVAKEVRATFNKMISMDYAVKVRNKIKNDRIFEDPRYYGVEYKSTKQAGTSNICIISPNGDAIVLTSSLMWDTGSFFYSNRTGIVLNTQLRNFAAKPTNRSSKRSPAQTVFAGRRAISPHAPTIVLDEQDEDVFFVVGASGSDLIPSQIITAVIIYCVMQQNAFTATTGGFFFPDPTSNTVLVKNPIGDELISKDILHYLKKVGHNLTYERKGNPYAIRNCIGHKHMQLPDMQFSYHEQGGVETVEPGHGFTNFTISMFIVLSLWIICWLIYEIAGTEYFDRESNYNYFGE